MLAQNYQFIKQVFSSEEVDSLARSTGSTKRKSIVIGSALVGTLMYCEFRDKTKSLNDMVGYLHLHHSRGGATSSVA